MRTLALFAPLIPSTFFACGSEYRSGGNLIVEKAPDWLRPKFPLRHFPLVVDAGNLLINALCAGVALGQDTPNSLHMEKNI